MDDESHLNTGSASNSATDDLEAGASSSGGAFFSESHHFTVAGGTFVNNKVTNKYTCAPIVPSDFRMIPMGDINLQHEISLDNNCTVLGCYQRKGVRVRRVYSARIDGRNSGVTVAMHQGDSAEEEWRQDIARYMTVRHPNIVQMHAAASSNNIYATVFHDDLISLGHFLNRCSPILKAYTYAQSNEDFLVWKLTQVGEVVDTVTGNGALFLFCIPTETDECTLWIRCSSGRLCLDLVPGNMIYPWYVLGIGISPLQGINPLEARNPVTVAIDALTLDDYHRICYWHLSEEQQLYCSASATVNLNTTIVRSLGGLVEIALLPEAEAELGHWATAEQATGEVMEEGWTCFALGDIFDTTLSLHISSQSSNFEPWLSQANHIFKQLGVTCNFVDHVVVGCIYFNLAISATSDDPPLGYLFLCSPEHFQTGPSSFKWPKCPAYWSLDQSGVERLSTEEAIRLGFPSFSLSVEIDGSSWDESVYDGLRQFHQGKGFDPDSQDIARHLGYPLFQLSAEVDPPFAHVDPDDGETEAYNPCDDIPPMLFLM